MSISRKGKVINPHFQFFLSENERIYRLITKSVAKISIFGQKCNTFPL